MNPNNPDPNSQNQPDLSSITPPPATPPAEPSSTPPPLEPPPASPASPTLLPDLNAQPPFQTPPDQGSGATFPPPQTTAPAQATADPMFTNAPFTTPAENIQAPSPLSSLDQLNTTAPTFTPPSSPEFSQTPEAPIQPTEQSTSGGGFNWPDQNTIQPGSPTAEALNIPDPITAGQSEPAPSDLSHLVNTAEQPVVPTAQPETLITQPTSSVTEVPNIPTEENHKGVPKWIIGLGVGLLLAVAAASAYFILGIGRTPPPASIPAEGTQESAPAVVPTAIPTITLPTQTPSTSSALPGTSAPATSAADLLRQRQGR